MFQNPDQSGATALATNVSKLERRSGKRKSLEKPAFGLLVFLAYIALLALAPLWYGAKPAMARALLGAAFALVSISMIAQHLMQARGLLLPMRSISIPVACCVAVVAWALMQGVVPVSSSIGDPAWALAAETLQLALPAHISASPADTVLAAATLAIVLLVFVAAFQLGADHVRAIQGLQALSVISAAYAVWGMVDHFSGWNKVLWQSKDLFAVASLNGYVSSTFSNADHFADLVLIGLAATASLAGRDLRHLGEILRLDRMTLAALWPSLRNGAVLMVLLSALWLTRSRAGFASGLLCILVFALLLALRLYASGRKRLFYACLIGASAIVALLVMAALETAIGASRFARLGDGFVTRWLILRTVLDAATDNLPFGTGFGAFRDAFAVYHNSELGIGAYVNAAHNVYLEAVFGLGLPMALVLFCGVGWIVWRVCAGALKRRQHIAAPIAAATASAGVLAHNFVDFSLQLPAVAILFAALLGFGCAQSWSSRQTD